MYLWSCHHCYDYWLRNGAGFDVGDCVLKCFISQLYRGLFLKITVLDYKLSKYYEKNPPVSMFFPMALTPYPSVKTV